MVDTIVFHAPRDVERAHWMTRALDDRTVLALAVQTDTDSLQFGGDVVVFGIWGGPGTPGPVDRH